MSPFGVKHALGNEPEEVLNDIMLVRFYPNLVRQNTLKKGALCALNVATDGQEKTFGTIVKVSGHKHHKRKVSGMC
jgi:hypothetical protein